MHSAEHPFFLQLFEVAACSFSKQFMDARNRTASETVDMREPIVFVAPDPILRLDRRMENELI